MRTLAEIAGLVLEMADNSITKLANIAGVKPPSVSDWLNGKTKTLKAGPSLHPAQRKRPSPGKGELDETPQPPPGGFFSPIKIFLGLPIDYPFRCA